MGVFMRIVLSKTGRFVGRISLQIVPSVTASVVGGYLLAQLVPQHTATPAETAKSEAAAEAAKPDTKQVAVSVKGAPIANDRAPIRVISQARREGQAPTEPLAEVKPVAPPISVAAVPAAQEVKQEAKLEPKTARAKPVTPAATASAVPAATPSAHLYTPEPYTPEPSATEVASQPVLQAPRAVATAASANPAPVANAPLASAPAVVAAAPAVPPPTTVPPSTIGAPTNLPPVTVTARRSMEPPPDEEDAEPVQQKSERGPAGHVFSAISNVAGTAANATGNTINWVFGLPGKLIGRDEQEAPQQQQASQPRRFM